MVDNEGRCTGCWAKIKEVLGDLLIQWSDGCLEEHVVPFFKQEMLLKLIEDPEGIYTGMRLRSLAERLDIEEADFDHIMGAAGGKLTQIIIEAATGKVPEKFESADKKVKKHYQGHASIWFKTFGGGRELAEKVITLGAWPILEPQVRPFLNAVRKTIGLPAIDGLGI
jgi:hypothetical protein